MAILVLLSGWLLLVAVLLRGRLLVTTVAGLLMVALLRCVTGVGWLLRRVIVALVLGLLRRLSAVAASIVARVSRHVGFGRRTESGAGKTALERGEVHSRDRWRCFFGEGVGVLAKRRWWW